MTVSRIIIHKNWDKNFVANDLALFKTNRPIKFAIEYSSGSFLINSVCLPQYSDELPDHAEIAGWGKTGEKEPLSSFLKKLIVPKVSNHICNRKYRKNGEVTEQMICYGGMGGADSCMVCMSYSIFMVFFSMNINFK